MSTPFQNRLVGTVIVAAAVIIFLPDLLDGKKESNQTDFEKIPQVSTFTGKMTKKPFPEQKLVIKDKVTVFNEQAQDDLLKIDNTAQTSKQSISKINNQAVDTDVQKTKVTPAIKVKKIVANAPLKMNTKSAITKPVLGQQPPKSVNKEAWVIQLGSFKHKSNVAELVTKLKRNGYTAFTKPIKTKQGTLTKVFVGPELIKATLMKKIPALKKLTNVQGKIARFYPTK
ncbi:SPOR domain-containing protein [Candidatus Colwellia aromaticivorans]|uniref:SPOR domain-containing protein n=1 Tax=Candidatus Colwellia aromaticivorans TaxID=2267621 RepID=UPI000DF4ACF7|nr:SPOR domain-containing protein [Candidatus Colwellia aromaticivorans]